MSLDYIFQEIGGFSRFQVLMIVFIYGMKIPTAWSMLQITFALLSPTFSCRTNISSPFEATHLFNETRGLADSVLFNKTSDLNACSINGTVCQAYTFLGDVRTIISEWSLVCSMKWIKTTITTIQMAGVLLGAMAAGQCGDFFGRKRTTFAFFLAHLFFNLITMFSVNWHMFATFRFLIGATIGANLVMTVPYCSEYLSPKWRSLIPIVPMWPIGTGMYAGFAYVIQDWRYLHLANIILSIPFLFGYFYVPESVRWLATKGRLTEAYAVVEKMATLNCKPIPPSTMDTLKIIATAEKERIQSGKKYTYLDLFHGRTMVFTSLALGLHWIVLAMVFYGLSFGAASFTGNLYLNIFIIGIIDIPGNLTVFYWSNRFGRKKSTIAFLLIASLASFGCLVDLLTDSSSESSKGSIVRGLSLGAKLGVSGSWVSVQTWVGELYPTVTRSLGYGFVNTVSRIGGMMAPFAINLDDSAIFSYSLMGCLCFISGCLLGMIPETFNRNLKDSAQLTEKCAPASGQTTNGYNVEISFDTGGEVNKSTPNDFYKVHEKKNVQQAVGFSDFVCGTNHELNNTRL